MRLSLQQVNEFIRLYRQPKKRSRTIRFTLWFYSCVALENKLMLIGLWTQRNLFGQSHHQIHSKPRLTLFVGSKRVGVNDSPWTI